MSRLGIDLRILRHARTGFFRYAQGALRSLAECPPPAEIVLIGAPGQALDELDHGKWERVDTDAPLFASDEPDALSAAVTGARLDAIWFPFSLFPGRVAPRVMLTLHDLTPLLFAETIEDRYRKFYRAALERAGEVDRLLTGSGEIAAALGARGLAGVEVVPPLTPFEGYGLAGGSTADAAREDAFVLVAGSLEPRKDPLRALAAWEYARERYGRPLRFVAVASHGWLEEEFHAAAAASRWHDEIDLRRRVGDAELVNLMRRCAVFLSASRHEGFGLPVLEAAWAGAPVLSTPVPSLTDAGVDAGLTLSADDAPPRIGQRLLELIRDPAGARSLAARMRRVLEGHYGGLSRGRFSRACAGLLEVHGAVEAT